MKKIFLLICGTFLAGCTTGSVPKAQITPSPSPTATPTAATVFSDIKDAVSKNLVIKCEYTDKDGSKTTAYIQGKSVRIIGADEKTKNVNGLIKDQKFYVWELNGKQGLVIDMAKISDANSLKMGETPVKNEEDIIAVLEAQKDKCAVSPADANMLEVPKDIEFKDFGGW